MTPTGHQAMPKALWWWLAGLTLAWGFNWTAMKVALAEFSPWTYRSLCLSLAALLLFGIAHLAGHSLRVPRHLWVRLAVLAFFNVTCWNMLIAFGLTMIPSGRAAILAFTMPVWSVPISAWLFGERITARKVGALVLGMSGLALLLGEDLVKLGGAPLGTLLVLGAAFAWAVGVVLQKRWPLGLQMGTFTAWSVLLGGVPVFAGTPFSRSSRGGRSAPLRCSRLPIPWWFRSPSPTGPGSRFASTVSVTVSSISVLSVPIFGVLCGVVFLGERPSLQEYAALLFVVLAILAINLPERKPQ